MTDEELSKASFWDERYASATSDAPTHEWFKDFESLKEPFLDKHLIQRRAPGSDPCILHLGCGDSTMPLELLSLGYRNQICIDFSAVVIDKMSTQYADKPGLVWICGDVRDMHQIQDQSIAVAFDKGTLDAMISGSPWDPPVEVRENIRRYLDEVARVLKPGALFLYVTFRQPHFMRPLLTREDTWDLHLEELNDGKGSFSYFGWVIEKRNP